jgi:signal transduction histidine kinase
MSRAGRSPSLRRRLLLAAALPLAALAVLGAVVLHLAFVQAVERAFDARLGQSLAALLGNIDLLPDGSLRLRRELPESGFTQVRSGWYWQVADRAGVLRRSRSLWDAELPRAAQGSLEPGPARAFDLAGPEGGALRAMAQVVRWEGSQRTLEIVVAGPRADIDAEIAGFGRLLALSVGGLVAIGTLALALQLRLGLAPLRRLVEDLDRIERGETTRVGTPASRELAQLADKLNAVLEHDQRQAERGRRLAGDLAHALKTPLAVLRAEIDAGRQPEASRAIARLDEVVTHHLARASAEARRQRAYTEVAPLADALRRTMARIHADRRLALQIEIPPGLRVACESEDLGEVLGNLLDNACRMARGRVELAAGADADGVWIRVRDDGPGLPDALLHQLGERGKRFDERSGTGLGVAIAREIVDSYGGSLDFTQATPRGLEARIRLPAAPDR